MNFLSIGGSDPSSGAGIQSDIKFFSLFNEHCLTVITAVTSQNTSKFNDSEVVSQKILKSQLKSVLKDFKINGIKIGMVYDSKTIKTIHEQIKKLKIPIVIDPVIKSTTGGMLLKTSALNDFKKLLVPLATVITPNEFEAKIITNTKNNKKNSLEKIAKSIQKMGAQNVVITGIKTKTNIISDYVLEKNSQYVISGTKIPKTNHGSGGNYSAAILLGLSKKKNLKDSVKIAKEITYNSIKNAKKLGKGIVITDVQKPNNVKSDLAHAIDEFVEIKNIYKNIPECQTNFVYTNQKPKSTKDILGLSGRIVKAGTKVLIAGDLTYGGSKHVATALLTINKKFPKIRSAVNIKFQTITLTKIKKSKLLVSSYDRTSEPKNVKTKGSTIAWGIKSAIKNSKKSPDVIYHKGDFGKEPMILVFGENPNQVLKKILKII